MRVFWMALIAAALLAGGCKTAKPSSDDAYPLPGVLDPVTERPVSHVLP